MKREDRKTLLNVAKQAIEDVFAGRVEPPDPRVYAPPLSEPGASFVTLRKGGALRGCIGSVEPRQPLVLDVYKNAIAAAFRDPRFPPLAREEWPGVELEVSVLSPKAPFPFEGYADLLRRLPEGVGVVLEHPLGRATYLPEVWRDLPEKRLFLRTLAQKAGLDESVYDDPRTRVYTYTAEAFTEADLGE